MALQDIATVEMIRNLISGTTPVAKATHAVSADSATSAGTAETARLWVKPWAGTTDMYHTGEYMIYTDDKIYRCLTDTVYSPEEYAQAWETI